MSLETLATIMTIPAKLKPRRRRLVLGIMLVGVVTFAFLALLLVSRSSSGSRLSVGLAKCAEWTVYARAQVHSRPDGSLVATGTWYLFGPVLVEETFKEPYVIANGGIQTNGTAAKASEASK